MKKIRCKYAAYEQIVARLSLENGWPDGEKVHALLKELGYENPGKAAARFRAFLEEDKPLLNQERLCEALGFTPEETQSFEAALREDRRLAQVQHLSGCYTTYLQHEAVMEKRHRPYLRILTEKQPTPEFFRPRRWISSGQILDRLTRISLPTLPGDGHQVEDLEQVRRFILEWTDAFRQEFGELDLDKKKPVCGFGKITNFAYNPERGKRAILFDTQGNIISLPIVRFSAYVEDKDFVLSNANPENDADSGSTKGMEL